jgi:hypothetical protein
VPFWTNSHGAHIGFSAQKILSYPYVSCSQKLPCIFGLLIYVVKFSFCWCLSEGTPTHTTQTRYAAALVRHVHSAVCFPCFHLVQCTALLFTDCEVKQQNHVLHSQNVCTLVLEPCISPTGGNRQACMMKRAWSWRWRRTCVTAWTRHVQGAISLAQSVCPASAVMNAGSWQQWIITDFSMTSDGLSNYQKVWETWLMINIHKKDKKSVIITD